MKGGIYAITNTVTGEQYVGSTVDFGQRWAQHRSSLRSGKSVHSRLQDAWNLHGESIFEFAVLERVDDEEDLRERELWHMQQLKPMYNVAVIHNEPMCHFTQAWPIELRRAIDAAAEQEGKTRSGFVLEALLRHPAVRKAMEQEG